ncbi:MAG: ABC transporter ATP-binding protein [Planctomycetes bacterium]|nr:ABC transporter ATP-binding protein [Planctomycetota bacterium]
MFQLQDVTKIYSRRGRHVAALQCSTFEIPDGDYAAVVGPSGSGKTTLLSVLGGMLSPNSGKVLVDGASLYDQSIARRAELRRSLMGFVFQTFNLVPYLTALENVQVPLYLAGHSKKDQCERAAELLRRVGLGERLDHKPSELSTGQQQRVALARTLANDPKVILADEPTGNLDPDSRKVVLDFLDELNSEGRTIVMVTHDAAAAERAKRWLRLVDGSVTAAAVGKLQIAA